MNTTEQLIFDQHMKNIDCRFEDFAGRVSNGDIAWQIIQGFLYI